MSELDTQPYRDDELLRVHRRRYQEALTAGLTIVEAKLFSESDQDVGTLRKCVRNGWTGEQIARVVI